MVDGFAATTFQIQFIEKYVRSVIYQNNWFFDPNGVFVDGEIGKGSQIAIPIEYSHTDNSGTYSYDDAMPLSNSTSGVIAHFNKDSYQAAVRTYNMLKAYNTGSGETIETALGTALSKNNELNMTLGALRARITAAAIADIEAQIDSSTAYSDDSLTLATYNLASYEDTTSGALTLNQMEDAVEALMSTTYGAATLDQLMWLMPINQRTNLGRLSSATIGSSIDTSYLPMTTDAQNPAPMDAGRLHRVESFCGIPIQVVPGMTSTVILLVRKGTLKRYIWRPFEVKEKDVLADQELLHIVGGANAICDMPSWNAKLSAKTA